ncbi:hypothetical protein APS_1866 [Acetobacter pasteurianus subsp. pasteurianus LMG 1262 = NBRC 106471]|nr:hypothetical protein APS_1866 [Acetobacter pasteurianus subsp. pasteurianus LMG 1262 = NBRC 106471]
MLHNTCCASTTLNQGSAQHDGSISRSSSLLYCFYCSGQQHGPG